MINREGNSYLATAEGFAVSAKTEEVRDEGWGKPSYPVKTGLILLMRDLKWLSS